MTIESSKNLKARLEEFGECQIGYWYKINIQTKLNLDVLK